MNFKVIIISILLLVLSVTAVSATDFDNNSVMESSDVDDSSIGDFFVQSSQLQDSKELNASTGTFNQLQSLIDNASEKSVLDLTMDYKGSKNSKIKLDKDLTINGNGHTIDCLDKEGCIAFYSSSGTITLKNLKIINGHHDCKENYVRTYGGAIYIDNKNNVVFSSNVFINNTCGDEGGAIYGDDNDFKISLKYNIFIGNNAGDTGDSVYICGHYKEIINNYWGGKNPTKKNGQLIEWMPLFVPNEHHVDSDPLTMVLVTDGSAIMGQTVTVTLMFNKSDGTPCTGPILNDAVVFNVSNAKIINKMSNEFSVSIDLIPEDVGSFEVSANWYGISVSETFRVYDGKITDSDINRLLQRISDLKNSS